MQRSTSDQLSGALGVVSGVVLVLWLWLITRIRYTIDDQFVRVVLFGWTLRKIAVTDIDFVDTAPSFWNEHWCNTLLPWGRVVRIRRKSGLVRNFIITPAHRDVFVAELRARLDALRR